MDTDLIDLVANTDGLPLDVVAELFARMPDDAVLALAARMPERQAAIPASPMAQALELDEGYRVRPHLELLSERLAIAANKVAAGQNQLMIINLPPRSGKTELASKHFPLWMLRRNPAAKIVLASHDPGLATDWARSIRRMIEQAPDLGIKIQRDGGAFSEWHTEQGGGITARSIGQSIVGRGFNIALIDDPIKDFKAAHSEAYRKAVWDWWTANMFTRLEPPYLVVVTMTRWHEDDLAGRLVSPEHEGDPTIWDVLRVPAIAEADDAIGREPGEPLYSPLADETREQALKRWDDTKRTVGTYTWTGQYQQRPAPPDGAVFNLNWFRYWTHDPNKADGERLLYLDPDLLVGGRWLDSWDAAFKGNDDSDYTVGQRWVRHGANRYLIDQSRARRTFTQTLAEMMNWASPIGWGRHVHQRLVEDKANGSAIIDTLRDRISGIKPVNPQGSKESRARAVSPEVESGNVILPDPAEHPWVYDFLAEIRAFPTGANDDQVDSMSQALMELRDPAAGHVTNLANAGTLTDSRAGGRFVSRASEARSMRLR